MPIHIFPLLPLPPDCSGSIFHYWQNSLLFSPVGLCCEFWDRTKDLQVMSLARYHGKLELLMHPHSSHQHLRMLKEFDSSTKRQFCLLPLCANSPIKSTNGGNPSMPYSPTRVQKGGSWLLFPRRGGKLANRAVMFPRIPSLFLGWRSTIKHRKFSNLA